MNGIRMKVCILYILKTRKKFIGRTIERSKKKAYSSDYDTLLPCDIHPFF